jgi:HEPN domain-containing protein
MGKGSFANKVWYSQDTLLCAEAFQAVAEKLFPEIREVKEGSSHTMPNEMGDVVACATNLAFALELYLKGLLAQLGLQFRQVHDLRVLYDAMPQPVRTLIESIYDIALQDEVRRLDGHVSFTFARGPLEEPPWEDYKVSLTLPDLLDRSKDLFQS